LPKFAVKSWEDKILGALVRCRRKRIKDHATLKNKALALFFFGFFTSHITAKPLNSVFLLAVKGWTRPVGAPEPLDEMPRQPRHPSFAVMFGLDADLTPESTLKPHQSSKYSTLRPVEIGITPRLV
jgi:hypothetical protein